MKIDDIFERVKKGEVITVTEMLSIITLLINSNTAFQLVFAPKSQTSFATLQLTLSINPKMTTSVTITLTG